MALCATREFRQIKPQSKCVFTRQVRPNRYLFPIPQEMKATAEGRAYGVGRLSIAGVAQEPR
jgi:hypothetical protein